MTVLRMCDVELSRFDRLVRVDGGGLLIGAAAGLPGIRERQVFRLLVRLRPGGIAGLAARRRPSNRRLRDAVRTAAIALVQVLRRSS